MNRKIYLLLLVSGVFSILKNAGIQVNILPPDVDEYSILADHPLKRRARKAKGESVLDLCQEDDIFILPIRWYSNRSLINPKQMRNGLHVFVDGYWS